MASIDELAELLQNSGARITEALSASGAATEIAEQLRSHFVGVNDTGSAERAQTVIDQIEGVLGQLTAAEAETGQALALTESIRD